VATYFDAVCSFGVGVAPRRQKLKRRLAGMLRRRFRPVKAKQEVVKSFDYGQAIAALRRRGG
jgi:hypothetical protein